MGETLEALHRLQVVERQLAQIRLKREEKERRVAIHKRQVSKAQEKHEKNKLLLRDLQMRLDAQQLEVSSRDQAIDKHRQALNKAKTNKEYAAILTAMNTEKADNAKIETQALQLMEEIQNLKTESEEIAELTATAAKQVAQTSKVLEKFDAASKPEVDTLTSQRDEYAQNVPPATLNTFTKVAVHHDGEAMAVVEKLNPKRDEYVCSGCNMNITLELVNSLQTRDEVQFCRICGRILYLPSQTTQKA